MIIGDLKLDFFNGLVFFLSKKSVLIGTIIFLFVVLILALGWSAIGILALISSLSLSFLYDFKKRGERINCEGIGCGKLIKKKEGIMIKKYKEPGTIVCKSCYDLMNPSAEESLIKKIISFWSPITVAAFATLGYIYANEFSFLEPFARIVKFKIMVNIAGGTIAGIIGVIAIVIADRLFKK